jgi:rod shape determining protein RodA
LSALVWSFGMRDYQRQRVTTFLQPTSDPLGAGYQVRQSKIAVGSGQLTGRGYRQGTQSQLRFLPARHTDFIFAVLAEEGLLGVAAVGPAAFLASAHHRLARRTGRGDDRGGATSTFASTSLQLAMVIGLVPNTGVPLPFLSYGGCSPSPAGSPWACCSTSTTGARES